MPPQPQLEDDPQFSPEGDSSAEGSPEQPTQDSQSDPSLPMEPDEVGDLADVKMFDIHLNLSVEQKEDIVRYLEDNLPKMRPPQEEIDKILGYLSVYEMSVRERNFPYEGAPSLASTDAHDHLNKWLDTAELAFLMQRTTFTIDREDSSFTEDSLSRIERTYHRKFFQNVFSQDIRDILFESSFLGTSVIGVRENFEVEATKKKIVIKSQDDIVKNQMFLTTKETKDATEAVSKGKIFCSDKDSIKIVHSGPSIKRIDQTKFWYPRNTKLMSEWKIVAEPEFYTKSSMRECVELGVFDAQEVKNAIETRQALYSTVKNSKVEVDFEALPSAIKTNIQLDSNWPSEMADIKQFGDAYEDEFAVYRCTLEYRLKTDKDPSGRLPCWIQVMYCPASRGLLGASFCQDGFPYELVRYRPVPYRAMGPGIAQERYNQNLLDTDLKSLFLASVEQEVGVPLLIRKTSSLWASGFRAYPSSVAYADDIDRDAKYLPTPDKAGIAAKGMSMVTGSTPMSNLGNGYGSGKREQIQQQQEDLQKKARVHSISMDLDKVYNKCWKIHCRISEFNTDENRIVDFVYDMPPIGKKLYILSKEMDPSLVWTSVTNASSLTPDARLQEAMKKFEFFCKSQPSMVNNPQRVIPWLHYMADQWAMDTSLQQKLLPTEQDFQQLQQQLGGMGGQRQQDQATPATAQSPSTPFSRPPSGAPQGAPAQPPQGQ